MNLLTVVVSWFLLVNKWADAQRRIINGHKVEADKPYMIVQTSSIEVVMGGESLAPPDSIDLTIGLVFQVYLVKHPWSHARYRGWKCGGAIIHPIHIITSATCVRDVYNIYVVSGLKRSLSDTEIHSNVCFIKTKRTIIYMCEFKQEEYNVTDFYTYDKSSNNGYDHATDWAISNLGLARVDEPFAFHSSDYTQFCDYKPAIISVNFLKKFEKPGTQAIVLGWGNTRLYRPNDDNKGIYTEPDLKYTPTVVADKKVCIEKYANSNLQKIKDDKTLLCTDGPGHLNDYGLPFDYDDICEDCEATTRRDYFIKRRWFINDTHEPKTTKNWLKDFGYGFCQNDQGGPLVTWIGGRETIIGIASTFMVTEHMECKGPFIFASTACSGRLIHCIVTAKMRRSSENCTNIARNAGFRIIETTIDWSNNSSAARVDKRGRKLNAPIPKRGPATILYRVQSTVSPENYLDETTAPLTEGTTPIPNFKPRNTETVYEDPVDEQPAETDDKKLDDKEYVSPTEQPEEQDDQTVDESETQTDESKIQPDDIESQVDETTLEPNNDDDQPQNESEPVDNPDNFDDSSNKPSNDEVEDDQPDDEKQEEVIEEIMDGRKEMHRIFANSTLFKLIQVKNKIIKNLNVTSPQNTTDVYDIITENEKSTYSYNVTKKDLNKEIVTQ